MSGRISLTAAWPLVVLCIVPLLAHLPELLGWVNTYPLLFSSSLVLHPHSGILPGRPFIDGSVSPELLSLGHRAAEDWLHGMLPWWNPYAGAGLPLASQMQPAAFFLPFILLLHFHSGVLLIKLAMQILAGLACFAFLRRLGLKSVAAVLGAVLFQCNGTFAWFSDAPMLPIAFIPLLLLGLERARTQASADHRGGEAMIALAIAFSLLAGYPETALMDGLLGLTWATLRIRGLGRRARSAFIWKTAAGGLAGLALAAPALIPFLQDLRVSALLEPISALGGRALSRVEPEHLAALLFPNIYGLPLANFDMKLWSRSRRLHRRGNCIPRRALPVPAPCFTASPRRRQMAAGALDLHLDGSVLRGAGVTEALRLVPGVNQVWISRYCMPPSSSRSVSSQRSHSMPTPVPPAGCR